MKKKLAYSFLLLILLFTTSPVFADWYPIVVNYTRSTYGSGSQNWSIIQTDNSWMYFGNNYGMLQFDGIRWTTFPVTNQTTVRSLLYHNKTIYAGAENDFGYYEPTIKGYLAFISLKDLLPKDKQHFGNVWKVHEMNGALFFQAEKSIFKYINNKIEEINIEDKIEYSTVVYNMLWVVTAKNTYYLAGDQPISMEYPLIKNKRIVSILPYEKGKQLFITAYDGIFIFDGKSIDNFETDVDQLLSSSRVFCATENKNFIVLGTVQNGIIVLDRNGKLFTQLNVNSGLCNNTVLAASFDKDNNLWLGLDDGIAFVALSMPITNLYGPTNSYGKGMASYLKNEYIYLGTNQSLLIKKWPIKTEQKPIELERIKGISGQVWNLIEINNDLFCVHDDGVFLIKENTAHHIEGTSGAWTCKVSEKNPDEIIIGTYDGFQVIKKDGETWRFSHKIRGFEGPITNFEMDGNYIWKSDNKKGIVRLQLDDTGTNFLDIKQFDLTKGLPANNNNAVYKLNNKIIFTTIDGVYKYDEKTDLMVEDTEINSILPGKRPYSSLKKQPGTNNYWYIFDWSSVGYSFYDSETKKFEFDTHTGQYFRRLLFDGFEHINPINDSCTLVGTEDGFSWINPQRIQHDKNYVPYLSIRRIWLRAENDSLIYGDNYKSISIYPAIPYQQNSLRIEFGATDYKFNSNLVYSYKLDNYDENWSEYSNLNIKEYTKLQEGEYVFRVKAKNNYMTEPVFAEFSFKVLPPWYRSNLAYGVYAMSILIITGLMLWFFNRFIEKKQQKVVRKKDIEMQQKEEEFYQQTMLQEKKILSLKQAQLEQELKLKSNELASTIMMVRDKNEIFSQINIELNKIYDNLKSAEIKKEVRKVQQKINLSKERDNYWKKFEKNFDVVHEDFFKKLSERYPMLTNNDKKLCAMLRMNLSSKEIAELLNISVRSVELSRYRLRKKIGLEREENLTEWIQNIEK